MSINGTAGNDNLSGTGGADSFDMSQGGNDKVFGFGDSDVFNFGAALGVRDEIDGGIADDTLVIAGDYSAGLTLRATSLVSVETFAFEAGFDYDITFVDANFSNTFTIDGRFLGATDRLIIDATADTDTTLSISGGAGDDLIKGGGGNDGITVGLGNDTAYGGAGVDTFQFNTNSFDAGDALFGGDGTDFISLFGDYSAGLTMTKDMIDSIEVMFLGGAFDFALTFANKSVDGTMSINASGITAGQNVVIDGHAEKNGSFSFLSSPNDDTFKGGHQGDFFNMSSSTGKDTIKGYDGDDTITFSTAFTAKDKVDGGAGDDLFSLNGDYSSGIVFRASTMVSVETLTLGGGHSYSLTLDDANVGAGGMTITASTLGAGETFVLDASAETDGGLSVTCGAGDATVTTGAGADDVFGAGGDDTIATGGGTDTIFGGEGADSLDGGGGADTFIYDVVSQSTSTIQDTINGFNANADVLELVTTVTGVDGQITTGTLSSGNFDAQLAAAVNSGNLAVDHAVVFTASGGNLSGHTYLIVERGGGAGYQAGQDLVIELTSGSHLASLSEANFS